MEVEALHDVTGEKVRGVCSAMRRIAHSLIRSYFRLSWLALHADCPRPRQVGIRPGSDGPVRRFSRLPMSRKDDEMQMFISFRSAFVVSCHAYQYAGTGYHRIHVTRKIPEFHVRPHPARVVPKSGADQCDSVQDLRAVSALPVFPLATGARSFLTGARCLSSTV